MVLGMPDLNVGSLYEREDFAESDSFELQWQIV